MSREVGPGDPLWSLPTLTILSFCENSGSIISSDCFLKQKPPAESHSRQGQGNWKPQCCTTNLTSYEVVINSLCGQQSTRTGQETGNAGVNVQQGREDMLYNPSKVHHIWHTILQWSLYFCCPALSDSCCKMQIQEHQVCGEQTFKEEKMGLQSHSSEHCRLLWKRCSEDKINISYLSFITSLAHNHSLSVYFSTTEIVYCPREYNVAKLLQRKKILLLENNSNHNQIQSKMLDSSFKCLWSGLSQNFYLEILRNIQLPEACELII